MAEHTSFRSIIELWPTREGMAADLGGAPAGASAGAVSKWWQRDRIPDEWWSAVLGTKVAQDDGLTADKMIALVARPVPVEFSEARAS